MPTVIMPCDKYTGSQKQTATDIKDPSKQAKQFASRRPSTQQQMMQPTVRDCRRPY